MKHYFLSELNRDVSRIALGFWRAGGKSVSEIDALVRTALDCGIDFFDHADIYAGGEAESLFGQVLASQPSLRDRMTIQSKCGIIPGKEHPVFDFSKSHILSAVEGSLKRLHVDCLDSLLLHRPDALVEPEEVAEAFSLLRSSGKVRCFGVSNMNAAQISLLRKYLPFPIVFNQLQLSVVHCPLIDQGFQVNMTTDGAINRDGSTFDYLREHGIRVQAWSVLQARRGEGTFLQHPNYEFLNLRLSRYAAAYGISPAAVSVAWLLRHPAGIQPILGTMNPEHLRDAAKADSVTLSHGDWYDLYWAAGKILP